MSSKPNLFVAILAGGSGTRFWPASTRNVPKQMLPLTGGAPLLRETVDRLGSLVPPERVLIVTAERYVAQVAEILPEIPRENLLGEPVARNTAAACALAAHRAAQESPDAVLVMLPADHAIAPPEELQACLAAAAHRAREARTLVTLGLRPRFAATGYGWIETGDAVATTPSGPVLAVARFTEKPDRERAEAFLAGGRHLWNLGMFAWRADVLLAEIAAHLPRVAEPLARVRGAFGTPRQAACLREAFAAAESISIDHGVLERSAKVECLPCSFAWDDLGAFPALLRHLPRDKDGNASIGPLVALDSKDCVTWAEDGRITALLGVEDLIVVHANGVTMVAPRDRAQDVKKLVERLAESGLEDFR